jgi:hypothetical protein
MQFLASLISVWDWNGDTSKAGRRNALADDVLGTRDGTVIGVGAKKLSRGRGHRKEKPENNE